MLKLKVGAAAVLLQRTVNKLPMDTGLVGDCSAQDEGVDPVNVIFALLEYPSIADNVP